MAEIITFRPTPEVALILAEAKAEGGNISKYINDQLSYSTARDKEGFFYRYSFYPESAVLPANESILKLAAPIGTLNLRRYKEFRDVLLAEGLEYHYFRIDDDHTVGIVAPCPEEACIEFAKYYSYDFKTKTYGRTAIPLPQVRYETATRTVVVITAERNNNQ